MLVRVVLSLLLLVACIQQAPAKQRVHTWQKGDIRAIGKPGEGGRSAWGTFGSESTPNKESSQIDNQRVSEVVPLASSFDSRCALAITLPEATYVVIVPPLSSKRALAKVRAGDTIDCAVEGKVAYLRDTRGSVYRARIQAR